MAEGRPKWPMQVTAAAMAADWVAFLVLNRRWLSASVEHCDSDSAPECGMFNMFPEWIFGTGTVLSVLGIAVSVWVVSDRTPALTVGALLHLAALCYIGLPISQAPISDGEQVLWGWIFGLANLTLACALFSRLATPQLPKASAEPRR